MKLKTMLQQKNDVTEEYLLTYEDDLSIFFFFAFFFLRGVVHLWHMEVPRLGVKSEQGQRSNPNPHGY